MIQRQRTNTLFMALFVGVLCMFVWMSCSPVSSVIEEKAEDQEPMMQDGGSLQEIVENDAGENSPDESFSPEVTSEDEILDEAKSHPICKKIWEKLSTVYPNAGPVSACASLAGQRIAESMFQLSEIEIQNNQERMTPCVDVKCDENFAYIVTNSLPHYDFVQTTPNPLTEASYVYRIPLTPAPIAADVSFDDAIQLKGCEDAYQQYLRDPTQGTQNEPSKLCSMGSRERGNTHLRFESGGKNVKVTKINCFGPIGFVLSGVPIFSPNEGTRPDPFGNPFMYTPVTGDQSPTGAAAMDLCFGHTAASMHHHGVNEACFERKADRSPKHSYATASMMWNWNEALTNACEKESDIVGWSFDGVPIKGSCLCTKRDAEGNCLELKRARSSWVYGGLSRWGDDPREENRLGKESTRCASDSDCCGNALRGCNYRCRPSLADDPEAEGGTSVAKRCMLLDYSWCVNQHIDRSNQDVSNATFIYLDQCNGYQGPDGYAYHITASFPLILGCYSFQPSDALVRSNSLLPRRP